MNVLEARSCLLLHALPDLGDLPLSRLLLHYGCAEKIWQSKPGDWRSLGVADEAVSAARAYQSSSGVRARQIGEVDRQLEKLQSLEAEVISIADGRYPALLRSIYDPPPILYAMGEIEVISEAQLGIVGSRRSSALGVRAARALSAQLVQAGLHITSGLAVGIDGAAHQGALEAGGKTLAVMASGLDTVYPRQHRKLAREVAQSGCLLTEFPPGCQPVRHRFPKRNRIISGLSLGVLVVEAALRSGSLITARTAMEQGREVFALPWSLFHESGRGCLGLIGDGVKMVVGIEDILDELGPLYQCHQELEQTASTSKPASGPHSAIFELIGDDPVDIDELVMQSGLPVSRLMSALSALEIDRKIARSEGGYTRS